MKPLGSTSATSASASGSASGSASTPPVNSMNLPTVVPKLPTPVQIVAPLLTPILGTALSVVLAQRRLIVVNLGMVIAGALSVVVIAHLLGLTNQTPLVADTNSQIAARVGPRLIDLMAALEARLDHAARADLDRLAPAAVTAPTGTRLPVDYSGGQPKVSVRLQEMFGTVRHPTAGAQVPLLVELLSPAGRPLQTTADLPGFWASSYGDVRREMRGRYPRHPWPEDPAAAAPTRRTKR